MSNNLEKEAVTLTVNGQEYEFLIGEKYGMIPPSETLVQTLRDRLQLTGAKESCNEGACGCCTVIKDGDAIASCMILTVECDGSNILTIEGLEDPETHALDPIQQAFIDKYAFQCGYCTPGIIMSAKALFMKNPRPTPEAIRDALSGNYCRCISHYPVLEALDELAAQ
jgi:carbon-monoxide dehydrogenase small subunit